MRALIVALGLTYQQAFADCFYNGSWYSTGTRIGNLTCQADGTWR